MFSIELPSSGTVLLAQPLDYESWEQVELVIFAVEINTEERHNATAHMSITVQDGDDQYPQFLPCHFLSLDKNIICVNPTYTGNVTETQLPPGSLQLSPGSIHAEDGDRGLCTPVTYTILTGADGGRFEMDNMSGSLTMTRPVRSRLMTPAFTLTVMASQVDDPSKYTMTTVLIHVLALNLHPPRFNSTGYTGFVQEHRNPIAVVVTFGNKPLLVQAVDYDFRTGRNPNIVYRLAGQHNHTQLFQVTQDGLLLAQCNRLRALDTYLLEVFGTDEESGEIFSTRVKIDVLYPGQEVPSRLPKAGRKFSSKEMGLLAGILGILLLLLMVAVILLMCTLRRRHRQQRHRGTVAAERNTNVSLKWFQLVNTSKHPGTPYPDLTYVNKGYSICGEEVKIDSVGSYPENVRKALDVPSLIEPNCSVQPILSNGKTTGISKSESVGFDDHKAAGISPDTSHQGSESQREQLPRNMGEPLRSNPDSTELVVWSEIKQAESEPGDESQATASEAVSGWAEPTATTLRVRKRSLSAVGEYECSARARGGRRRSVSEAGEQARWPHPLAAPSTCSVTGMVTATKQLPIRARAASKNPVKRSRTAGGDTDWMVGWTVGGQGPPTESPIGTLMQPGPGGTATDGQVAGSRKAEELVPGQMTADSSFTGQTAAQACIAKCLVTDQMPTKGCMWEQTCMAEQMAMKTYMAIQTITKGYMANGSNIESQTAESLMEEGQGERRTVMNCMGEEGPLMSSPVAVMMTCTGGSAEAGLVSERAEVGSQGVRRKATESPSVTVGEALTAVYVDREDLVTVLEGSVTTGMAGEEPVGREIPTEGPKARNIDTETPARRGTIIESPEARNTDIGSLGTRKVAIGSPAGIENAIRNPGARNMGIENPAGRETSIESPRARNVTAESLGARNAMDIESPVRCGSASQSAGQRDMVIESPRARNTGTESPEASVPSERPVRSGIVTIATRSLGARDMATESAVRKGVRREYSATSPGRGSSNTGVHGRSEIEYLAGTCEAPAMRKDETSQNQMPTQGGQLSASPESSMEPFDSMSSSQLFCEEDYVEFY
eukprot:gi/632984314/ref/XP_007909080.1/ PREDICTED: uncharacterized protein LOC103190188 [Callorhinchus milii]